MGTNQRRRIGIRDVADAAGVSPTTVSHALSGKGRLTQETRDNIARVARKLGYRPNANARNLVSGRTGLVGITVSTCPDAPIGLGDFDYFIQLLSAATGAAVEHGLSLVVDGASGTDDVFGQIEIDGAIVVDPIVADPLLDSLEAREIPIVTTGRRGDEPGEAGAHRYWIDNDHRGATHSILDHLAECGARRIGLVTTPPVTSYTRDALEGYEQWCRSAAQEPAVAVAEGAINEQAGMRAAGDLLDGPDRPDAIYATLDQIALGVLLAARTRSIPVPADLMVAGYTDSRASVLADPPLTAAALNPEEIGSAAVAMLAGLIEGNEPKTNPVIVETELLPRESTARLGR